MLKISAQKVDSYTSDGNNLKSDLQKSERPRIVVNSVCSRGAGGAAGGSTGVV